MYQNESNESNEEMKFVFSNNVINRTILDNLPMKKDNIILEKSYKFSLNIISTYKLLLTRKEYIMSKQLLRSGTSVGANIHEAQGSISKKEFIVKMQIAYKELIESEFWLNLLRDSNYLTTQEHDFQVYKLLELRRILVAIQKKMK